MARYYCPYCSDKYQFPITRSDGKLVCGQCGDELLKIPIFRPAQIIGLIAAIAFIAPLIIMLSSSIQIKPIDRPKEVQSIVNS